MYILEERWSRLIWEDHALCFPKQEVYMAKQITMLAERKLSTKVSRDSRFSMKRFDPRKGMAGGGRSPPGTRS